MKNEKLMTETLEYIRRNPKEFDHQENMTDTTADFAGIVCLLSGADRIYVDSDEGVKVERMHVCFNYAERNIEELAAELLGIEFLDLELLQDPAMTIDEIQQTFTHAIK